MFNKQKFYLSNTNTEKQLKYCTKNNTLFLSPIDLICPTKSSGLFFTAFQLCVINKLNSFLLKF